MILFGLILIKSKFEIKPIAEEHLVIIESYINQDWGNLQKHRERFERQKTGELTYLIAWINNKPTGHASLEWQGKSHKALSSIVGGCPNIDDLFVHPDHRSSGIGTLLLQTSEKSANDRNYTQIGLGVSIDNIRARTLYEKLGYKDIGAGDYIDRWKYTERDGSQAWHVETCNYLVKNI